MTTYFLRRLLWLIPVLITVSLVTFTIMHNAPGSPWDATGEGRRALDASTQQKLETFYGLDKPIWRQFIAYTFGDFNNKGKFECGAMCGNLGPSYRQKGLTVQQILFSAFGDNIGKSGEFWYSRFGYSLRLGLLALGLAISVGIPIGMIAALRQNTWVDYMGLGATTIGVSIPSFVLGLFLIIIFATWLDWINVIPKTWSEIKYWILPAVALGFNTCSFTARLTRAAMLEVMRQDFVRTARAKGLAERIVVIGHMLKNALIPVVTILGPALAGLVTGSFIIETIFSFPGMGRAYVLSIAQRDYSMIMGTTLIYALLIAIANLSVDFVYVLIDPRIRLEE
ncbi:MAG TPA: ABC transporter permease [Anaerolineales bacterium]|nr:ABC transporter permease [Anaerolineales bacterium]